MRVLGIRVLGFRVPLGDNSTIRVWLCDNSVDATFFRNFSEPSPASPFSKSAVITTENPAQETVALISLLLVEGPPKGKTS